MMRYFCCDELRRASVRNHPTLNGIDFLEVMDREAAPCERQRLLRIHFVRPPESPLRDRLGALAPENVRIVGGVRVRDVHAVGDPTLLPENVLEIRLNTPGDFSPYTLSLVEATGDPLAGMDPLLSAVDFSFKVECPTDLDCRAERVCPPEQDETPEIDYLAKDYSSFRRLMLDRLSVIMPQWRERNPADVGVALVELLAYVGDRLSYEQDAVATEAYLGTARRRSSVRRHARLLDYFMHDGCNARVWVQVRVNADDVLLPGGTKLLTAVESAQPRVAPDRPGETPYSDALSFRPVVFETMHDATLHQCYERLPFYTWGDSGCCLPQGAVRATLLCTRDKLKQGDVLVFMEEIGPRTGKKEDADPTRRHAVRLSKSPVLSADPLHGVPVTEIEWAAEDALPFPLCLSATTSDGECLPEVSVARGNIVLADHGRTVTEELPLAPAADPRLARVAASAGSPCEPHEPEPAPPRYRPSLENGPLTMTRTAARTEVIGGRRRRMAFDPCAPAAAAFPRDMERVLPAIRLADGSGRLWFPQRDLLASDEFAPEFAVEVDEGGFATLRFGDDEHGLRPAAGSRFTATYRVGNGAQGTVGAMALAHIVTSDERIEGVSNPLPARGGVDPETIEEVRQYAPSAFRVQQRAVTPRDYAEVAQRHPQVQRAAATLRRTGSWHTVFLTVDRVGGGAVTGDFEAALRRHMERYRMAGHDLEIDEPRFVHLEIELFVCVLPDYYRSDVTAALREVFSNQALPDGRRGFFHPDNFTFAQPVYLSRIYAAAQAVPGVRFVEVRTFQRLGIDSRAGLDEGLLPMGRLEIARLDNDPSFRERGVLHLTTKGGR